MYISKVTIVNYRNFKNAKFNFNKGINTIIGENGSGKTNLFRAVRLLLDDELLRFSYKLNQEDFSRGLTSWKGHWIIISLEFSNLSSDESIQSLFIHSTSAPTDDIVDKATYNLFFRPKAEFRLKLSELQLGDKEGMAEILDSLTIDDYESTFTGKSSVDFTDENVYTDLVGDFEAVDFNFTLDNSLYGIKIPHQLSISNDVNFTFIKALRDVVGDFNNNRTNPLLTLLKYKSNEISEADYKPISDAVKKLNTDIERLKDVQEIRANIKETIKEAVGETYAPSSLSIKSSLPDEAEKLLQSLRLFIGEPDEDYEGGIHELSLGGANLIFLTLKLLEFKYQKTTETFANFLFIEEPEAHLHTHIQKTLFDKLEYGDTQIIYSTHSTFISESSNISNVNILSKQRNRFEIKNTIPEVYVDPATIKLAENEIDDDNIEVYGKRMLTMAKNTGKGWYAIILGGHIGFDTVIPEYILDAILFAKTKLSDESIMGMVRYRTSKNLQKTQTLDFSGLEGEIFVYETGISSLGSLADYLDKIIPNDQIVQLLRKL